MSQSGPVSLSQRSNFPWMKAVVYGASGVGKTVFTCASQHYTTFVFDVDDGAESAAAFKGDPQHGTQATRRDHVLTWRINSSADFDAAYAWLIANQSQFQLVVIDTATELQRLVMGEICQKHKKLVPDQQCWGEILVWMERVARLFRHLPFHVTWVAHEKGLENKDTGRTSWKPNFSGDFAIQYAKHFGLIARYVVTDQQQKDPATEKVSYVPVRALNCQKDECNEAKDRSQALDKWEVPNIDNLIYKWVTAIQQRSESSDEDVA